MFRVRDVERGNRLRAIGVVALSGIAILTVWAMAGCGRAAAETPNRAGLVVTISDGYSVGLCVEFVETEISGADLLERSGLPVVSIGGGMGAAVCKIGDVGCDNPNDCFCHCHGAECQYWAYYILEDGQWRYSNVGASLRKVHHGDVDGWAWGSGKAGDGATPQLRTFQEICTPPTRPPPPPPPTQPPPPAMEPTMPPAVEPESTAYARPAVSPQSPTSEPTSQPIVAEVLPARSVSEGAQPKTAEEDKSSGIPPQLVAFAGLAAALLVTAVVALRRRARG